jgi:primosomal protein N' (replication factor Y)
MYPPFYRLIQIDILHKEKAIVDASTQIFYEKLRREFGYRLLGPSTPVVSRIRTYYIKELLLKLELNQRFIKDTKLKVLNLWNEVKSESKFATCRIKINVDPF